jgi:hypothetical protein
MPRHRVAFPDAKQNGMLFALPGFRYTLLDGIRHSFLAHGGRCTTIPAGADSILIIHI